MFINQIKAPKSLMVLIGYMGSGKSTVGLQLSKILNFGFVDLDQYISEKEGIPVSEIFNKKGEIYFRKKESLYLKEVLLLEKTVIALGGGTPCYANNMDLISQNEHVTSVYLKASIQLLSNRLKMEQMHRPLISHIKDPEAFVEFVGKHLFERSHFYNQADFTISIDGKETEEIVSDIERQLF